MANDEFKAMMENNIWHDASELQPTIDALKPLFTQDPEHLWKSISGWHWSKNPGCRSKYIDIKIRIDMRDGGFILMDRNGNRISLPEIQAQKSDTTISKMEGKTE